MAMSITRPGSWASAVDNTPRRLLQPGGFGLCAGVLESRRQAWHVQYGLYKGQVPQDKKKPPNLKTSYRPVVAQSPVTGLEAHSTKTKQDSTLEASGSTPRLLRIPQRITGSGTSVVRPRGVPGLTGGLWYGSPLWLG